ncbi:MAG: sugar phosphate isomerase/epimerase [bacterium]|nr:sugar phosphate isomerase/epimerase [bacterium]MCP4966991.1 sugar phosphate isomerase/epimerase [bacterium]
MTPPIAPTSGAATSIRSIGIEIFYFMDRWMDDQAAYFATAKECGYDGVEISLMPHVLDEHQRILAEADRLDLAILCSTGLSPETDISHPDPAVRRAGIEFLKRCLDTAHQMRSPILGGVTYAPWFGFPDDDLQERRFRSAQSLHEVAIAADAVGVDVCVEVLNRFESFMFNTVEQANDYLALVDHPSVKIELDTFHMNVEESDLAAAVRNTGSRLGHFQVAASNRSMPGKGHIDWAGLAAALDDVRYQGWVVVETFPNPEVETGRSTHAFRPLVADLHAEAIEAESFVRSHFGSAAGPAGEGQEL